MVVDVQLYVADVIVRGQHVLPLVLEYQSLSLFVLLLWWCTVVMAVLVPVDFGSSQEMAVGITRDLLLV